MTEYQEKPAGQAPNRVTMRDVAALAGVSLKTVSRVANGEVRVTESTRSRVQAVMDQLGYSRDLLAGSLRRIDGRTQSIALVLIRTDDHYDAAIARAVQLGAHARQVAVFISTTDESPDRERELVAAFTSRRVDGLIMMPSGDDHSYLRSLLDMGKPVVAVDREPTGVKVDCVLTDHLESARLATEHLIKGGHRRIAFLGDLPEVPSARARLEGYRQAMAVANAPVDPDLVSLGNHTEEQAHNTTLRMVTSTNPPTAVFSSQDVVTFGTVRALHERSLQRQIALVGFDDFPMADLLEPALTVIAQDPQDIGRLAVERVFQRLTQPGLDPVRTVVPARLIRRGSGEIPPPNL